MGVLAPRHTYIFILYMFNYQVIVQKLTVNYWVTGNSRTAAPSAEFALSHTSFPTHRLAPSFRAQLSAFSWLRCEADRWTLFKNTYNKSFNGGLANGQRKQPAQTKIVEPCYYQTYQFNALTLHAARCVWCWAGKLVIWRLGTNQRFSIATWIQGEFFNRAPLSEINFNYLNFHLRQSEGDGGGGGGDPPPPPCWPLLWELR